MYCNILQALRNHFTESRRSSNKTSASSFGDDHYNPGVKEGCPLHLPLSRYELFNSFGLKYKKFQFQDLQNRAMNILIQNQI